MNLEADSVIQGLTLIGASSPSWAADAASALANTSAAMRAASAFRRSASSGSTGVSGSRLRFTFLGGPSA